jgi:hypothetical protein
MRRWSSCLQIRNQQVRLLIRDPDAGDVLKAVLPPQCHHPRALLTLLEGLALYQGGRLCTVISAEPDCLTSRLAGLLGDELWPAESQLVQFDIVVPGRRRRLSGMGKFETLRRTLGEL